ncbi:hypothetical protein CRG98_029453 [Punica granatum]|nr:hypothetical protein CRG98_029453 [Punica granatum]
MALALFAPHALFLVSEGRPIRSMQESGSIPSVNQSVVIVAKQKVIPPSMAINQRIVFAQSDVTNMDDFRPTSPENSPGAGHLLEDFMKKAGAQEQTRHMTVKDIHPLTGSSVLGDFRSTEPGHSPGVGHTAGNVNSDPKH